MGLGLGLQKNEIDGLAVFLFGWNEGLHGPKRSKLSGKQTPVCDKDGRRKFLKGFILNIIVLGK